MLSLNLAHRRNVSLRDLMVILHVVLQHLVVVVLHLFACYAADFGELVCLIVRCFGHAHLVLRVECHFLVGALKLGHERRG